MKALWIWHAIEETEHKAVAFDVYQATGGSYLLRVLVMAQAMIAFPIAVGTIALLLLAGDRKLFDLRDLRRFIGFAWSRGGFVRDIGPSLKAYFRRDFHPWNDDNHELIEAWSGVYGPHVEAEV